MVSGYLGGGVDRLLLLSVLDHISVGNHLQK
jgi:hypothetical protein